MDRFYTRQSESPVLKVTQGITMVTSTRECGLWYAEIADLASFAVELAGAGSQTPDDCTSFFRGSTETADAPRRFCARPSQT